MKKGVIFYVKGDEESLNEDMDLQEAGEHFTYLAISESDVAYGWLKMITHGIHTIFCVKANYSEDQDTLKVTVHRIF
jgi:hypothetical protein